MNDNTHLKAYVDFLESKAKLARPLLVVCDSSNGPTGMVMRELSRRIGNARFILINDDVHPDFPAHGPDPSSPLSARDIASEIAEAQADMGVIFDGDGDRAVFVDECGNVIQPHVAAMCLMEHASGTHVADTLIGEVIRHANPELAKRVVVSKVGRYFVNQAMKKHDGSIGAEFSGHFFFKDFFYLDAAILTMIFMLNFLSSQAGPFSETLKKHENHFVASGKSALSKPFQLALEGVKAYLAARSVNDVSSEDGMTVDFGDSWVNVRASNTEPIARITAGSDDKSASEALVANFKGLLS